MDYIRELCPTFKTYEFSKPPCIDVLGRFLRREYLISFKINETTYIMNKKTKTEIFDGYSEKIKKEIIVDFIKQLL